MSFPNIPDITPDISLTLEDAVNLLLTSIAMEEMSLSKLMDAETAKILCVLNDCRRDGAVLPDAIEINESVNNTIQNMIKLQMLLQFKLEKVKCIIPTSSTTTTTTTYTTTTCSTTTHCGCCLHGQWEGCVENHCDVFYGDAAVVNVCFNENDQSRDCIRYSVIGNDGVCLTFYSRHLNLDSWGNAIVLYGRGQIRQEGVGRSPLSDLANFKLSLCGIQTHQPTVQMDLIADTDPCLSHTSGIICAKWIS